MHSPNACPDSAHHTRRRHTLGAWLVVAALGCGAGAAWADPYAEVSALTRNGKVPEALARAEQHLATRPRDPQMRFLRANLLATAGRPAEAVQALRALIEDYPELPEPHNNLAVLLASQGEDDAARAALENAIRLHPGYAAAHENLGDMLLRQAQRSYQRALQLEPANRSVAGKLERLRTVTPPAPPKQP